MENHRPVHCEYHPQKNPLVDKYTMCFRIYSVFTRLKTSFINTIQFNFGFSLADNNHRYFYIFSASEVVLFSSVLETYVSQLTTTVSSVY